MQTSFKERLRLIVDKHKPGVGSTNDGNTARRFFANPKVISEITSTDEILIENFPIILRVIACGKKSIYLNLMKSCGKPKIFIYNCTVGITCPTMYINI